MEESKNKINNNFETNAIHFYFTVTAIKIYGGQILEWINRLFRITIFRPPGVLQLKFLHALENYQGLLAHSRRDGCPPTIFNNNIQNLA